jgi:hypothetical protein
MVNGYFFSFRVNLFFFLSSTFLSFFLCVHEINYNGWIFYIHNLSLITFESFRIKKNRLCLFFVSMWSNKFYVEQRISTCVIYWRVISLDSECNPIFIWNVIHIKKYFIGYNRTGQKNEKKEERIVRFYLLRWRDNEWWMNNY